MTTVVLWHEIIRLHWGTIRWYIL